MIICDIPPEKAECRDPLCEKLMKCKHSVLCEICCTEEECVEHNKCGEFQYQLWRTD